MSNLTQSLAGRKQKITKADLTMEKRHSCKVCAVAVVAPYTAHAAANTPSSHVRDIAPTAPCVEVCKKSVIKMASKETSWTFDSVFKGTENQESLWTDIAQPGLHQVMQGVDSTLIHYGQTGSGKTYTTKKIITHFLENLFTSSDSPISVNFSACQGSEVVWKVSMVEVYSYARAYKDLLRLNNNGITIKQGRLHGATESKMASESEAMAIIAAGLDRRTTASHKMNASSSRSHLIISFHRIVRPSGTTDTAATNNRTSSFTLVDLAGSEKRQKTGVAKDSLMEKEGTAINQSLTVLGRVCAQLGDPKRSHIAYRDDHLTRALQSSMSGKGQLTLIAHVNPDPSHAAETAETLNFAKQASLMRAKTVAAAEPMKQSRAELEQDNLALKQRAPEPRVNPLEAQTAQSDEQPDEDVDAMQQEFQACLQRTRALQRSFTRNLNVALKNLRAPLRQ
ncbi:hypothetical protein WJX84_003471 [Apatococcus fuscideae]|uniref:Kinesin-like protein n=1 Tax=Apatococcus fuscideae TaxID=2026836 RepID=A0AAW1T4M5_9CHLO